MTINPMMSTNIKKYSMIQTRKSVMPNFSVNVGTGVSTVILTPTLPPKKTEAAIQKATDEQKAELRKKYNAKNIVYGSRTHISLMDDLYNMNLISHKDYASSTHEVPIRTDLEYELGSMDRFGNRLGDEPEWLKALSLDNRNLLTRYEYGAWMHKVNADYSLTNKLGKDPIATWQKNMDQHDSSQNLMNVLSSIFE